MLLRKIWKRENVYCERTEHRGLQELNYLTLKSVRRSTNTALSLPRNVSELV